MQRSMMDEQRRLRKNRKERERKARKRVEILTERAALDTAIAAPWEPEAPPAPTAEPPKAKGEVKSPLEKRITLPGGRMVFTSAQNNTLLHEGFWNALLSYCRINEAALYVSKFTYDKAGWQKNGGLSQKKEKTDDGLWFDERITPYVLNKQAKVAEGLVFCGELDILPTASNPLSGLDNYTGPNSGIVPHAKVAMKSLPSMKHEPARFMYTTGTCTQRNYIERKAGQVATFHHVYGALVVELDDDGEWFARQLIADDTGGFYDLNEWYSADGRVGRDHIGPIVTLGDIHVEKMDHVALRGAIHMMRHLEPEHIFLHDLIDFEARNHHNIKDPHFLAKQRAKGTESVRANMEAGARFVYAMNREFPNSEVHVIRSNHDQAFERWLKDVSFSMDPINAGYWHYWNHRVHQQIDLGNDFDVFAAAIGMIAAEECFLISAHWVQEDESVVIYDIEHGMHGHRGANGSRGTPNQFRRMGRKSNTGHTHSCGIIDGVYTAGVLAELDMGYNAGPSSWSHSHIITYPNGKRCIITQKGDKWRA
jgi:hypothetical protein